MRYVLEEHDPYDSEDWGWYEIASFETYEEAMAAYHSKKSQYAALRVEAC